MHDNNNNVIYTCTHYDNFYSCIIHVHVYYICTVEPVIMRTLGDWREVS